jgi:2-keto-4-pentenoate hydratase
LSSPDKVQRESSAALDELAYLLLEAEASAVAIDPVSEQLPGTTIAEAYAIQSRGRAERIAAGARLVGHKIGLTSTAMQQMVGVDEPDYGYLLDTQVYPDRAHVPAERFVAPRVEGELAFLLAAPLAGAVSALDVLAATRAIAPALEIIDSRVRDWRITIVDTIADNASCGAAIVGEWVELSAVEIDLAAVEMLLTVDGDMAKGRGDAVLGHPAESVAWLALALGRQGETLNAGEIVLSGALARALPISPGSRAEASFGALGSLQASF